jgi:hypothetical protein
LPKKPSRKWIHHNFDKTVPFNGPFYVTGFYHHQKAAGAKRILF